MCWEARMISTELDNLVKAGQLKKEPPNEEEIASLLNAARARLDDVKGGGLSFASRFDLTYNAAHSLALAALRHRGYRANNRYIVFQSLVHTVDFAAGAMRVFAICHSKRNVAEYEGQLEEDDALLDKLVELTGNLLVSLEELTER